VPGPVLVTQTPHLDHLMTTPSAQLAPVSGTDWPWLQSAVQMARIFCRDWPSGLGSRGNWTTPPRVATRKPAPAAASIGPSRAFALRTMHRWGEADRANDVAAVVSELLANAVRHALPQAGKDAAPWPIRLGLLHAGSYVVCAVADPGAGIPVLSEPDYLEESGRGLLVVASLSDQWGYCPAPEGQKRGADDGKVVWAAFAAASLF
jgi:anti-sigma regulatory factor (Ser/Thr protein kinase)